MREIYKNLYVGSEDDADKAREKGYAIVSACKDGKTSHRQLLGYTSMGAPRSSPEYLVARRKDHLYLNLIDGDDPAYVPDKIIDAALNFISEHLDKGQPVLVHCVEGISRSPSIVLMWLVKNGKLPTEGAVRKFKQLYPDYSPSLGIKIFTKQRIAARR
jgi:predicted protein tyrosine phosphatase